MLETVYVGRQDQSRSRYLSPYFWFSSIFADVKALYVGRFILANLVKTQLTTRYHRSSLGFAWTLLNPLLMLSVQAIVFSQVFKMNFAEFVVYLFAGLLAWQFIATGIDSGSKSLIIHEAMLRKISIPKMMCPMAEILSGCINLVFQSLAIFVLLLILTSALGYMGHSVAGPGVAAGGKAAVTTGASLGFHPQLVIFPVAAVLLAIFLFGVSMLGMTLVTWFRDFEHLLGVFLSAIYFAIPIVYPRSFVSDTMMEWLKLNPLFHFVSLFQHAIALGTWPSVETWTWAVASAVIALAAGYVTYKVFEDDYIYRL